MLKDVYKQSMSEGYVGNISDNIDDKVSSSWQDQLEVLTKERETCRLILLKLLVSIAENLRHTPEILSQLAEDEHVEVRIAVADNVHTSAETLKVLAGDACADVRYAIAENHNIPTVVLMELTQDDNPYVALRAEKTLRRLQSGKVLFGGFGTSTAVRAFRAASAF